MIKKIVFGGALALVIAGISTPDASALCNPPKFISTFNSINGEYIYWTVAANSPAQLSMQTISNGGQDTGGTCNFLYWGASPGQVGMSGDYGQECALPATRPCPSGNISIIGQAGGSFFGATVAEIVGAPLAFDFSALPGAVNHLKNSGSAPRPKVNTSSRVGSSVNLSLQLDGVNANPGFDSATAATIVSYNVLSAAGTTDPGRSASAYTPLANAPAAGGGPASIPSASVDCSNIALDRWVVTQIVTTAGPFSGVGPATQVKCNGALADPKYKPIKGTHPGQLKN